MRARLGLLLALALLAAPFARGAFDDLGAGARAPGMGNAFTALSDDAYAIYYNPAGLAQLDRPQFSAAYSQLYTGLSDGSNIGLSQFAYAYPLDQGRQGTVAASWQRLGVTGLYSEQTFYLSYGRRLLELDSGAVLMGGINAKYLMRSFTPLDNAANACSGLSCNLGPDPVLEGTHSRSVPDADAGFLYRLPNNLQLGLSIQRLLTPDVGFSEADRLPTAVHTGVAYKSLWLNLAGELQFNPAPDGSTDKDAIVAAERYFATADYGQFGVRGSLGLGTREWKQVTAGISYRASKMQFDYGLMLPFATAVKGTSGTHRIAITVHFGAPRAADEYSTQLAETLRRTSRQASEGYAYEFETLRRLPASDQVLGEMIRANIEQGRYETASRYLNELVKTGGAKLTTLRTRLGQVAAAFPSLSEPRQKWEQEMSQGIREWLVGLDAIAVKRIAYAYSLQPNEPAAGALLAAVESASGRKGERVEPKWAGKLSLVEEKLLDTDVALREGRYDKVERLCGDVLELEPSNPTALSRLGTAQFLQGRYEEALGTWTEALHFEEDPEVRRVLESAIRRAEEKLRSPGGEPRPRVPAVRPPSDRRQVQDLYREALESYVAGDKPRAVALFRRILDLDPDNVQARTALKHLENEP